MTLFETSSKSIFVNFVLFVVEKWPLSLTMLLLAK